MSEYTLDVIADILSRLPVKFLLQLRCVSKSWCALIDSSYFIKLHLNRSVQTKTNRSIIFREFGFRKMKLYSIDLDSVDHVAVEVDHPLKNDEKETEVIGSYGREEETQVIGSYGRVIGSCDGLLCLFTSNKHIALWNPSTRKHHKLPVTPTIEIPRRVCNNYHIVYGFGYDSVSDDYKVVRIIQYFGKEGDDSFDSEVKVYSLKSNSWRKIQDFPYFLSYKGTNAKLASGALHWVVTKKKTVSAGLIAAFDLGVEECRLVPQPNYSNNEILMHVVVVGGLLCVVLVCDYYWACVDIWVMREYGVKESWSKLFCVTQFGSIDYVFPLAFSKCSGELLVVLLAKDDERFMWYDLKMKTFRNIIEMNGVGSIVEPDICFGSLIPLRF